MLNELRKNRSPDCISDLEFDEWASDELSADDARRLEAHVASCEVCGGRRAELALLAQQFLQDAPRLREAPAAPERERAPGARSRPRALPWNPRVAALSVAACGTALALFLGVFSPGDRGVRSKGGPHLGFYVKRGDRVTVGLDGQRVHPGDLLRFVVTTDRRQRLAVLSLDSRGRVSMFSAPRLAVDGIGPAVAQPLETSIELDSSPGFEHVYAVFCDAPVEIEKLASTLETRHVLEPMKGCVLERLNLVKDAP